MKISVIIRVDGRGDMANFLRPDIRRLNVHAHHECHLSVSLLSHIRLNLHNSFRSSRQARSRKRFRGCADFRRKFAHFSLARPPSSESIASRAVQMPRARKSAFQAMSRRQGDAGCAGATAREEGGCRECALSRRGPRSPTRLSPRNQTASRHGFRALIIAVMAAAACLFATTHALPYDAVNADTCRQLVARASQGDLSRVRYLVERMHVSVDCAIARSDGDPHPWALDDVYRDHLDVPAGQLPRRSSHARSLSELMDEEDAEDVTALGNVHRSALHAAVAGGHVEVARFLLASGATADGPARVRLPQSISMASWLMGNAEEEEPTNVFRPYHADAASLTASAVNGVLERSFLSASSSSSSGGDDSNESSSQTFRHWMESDSNVDPRTPLTMAIINNGRHSARIVSDLVKLLILHGASVQVRDSLRMTPLMHVMASCDDGSRDTQPLSLVEDLIEAGANVNAADADGDSVLALALENGCSLDMVQFLVNRGARVEGVANRNGVSLLMRAMEWQLSISGEVRLTAARSFQSLTQLHMPRILLRRHRQQREAASHAESDMGNRTIRLVRLLLAHNADPAHTDRAGNTVLHVALRNRQSVHVISELLSVLNYVDTPDRRGRTPLMLALLYRCDLAIVQRLIQAGADCRAQIASSGRTAMHFAVAGRHTQPMFNMLMMCGSDPGTVDANGMSPLHHLIARRAAHYSDSRVMQEETAVAEALLDHMGDNSMLQSGGALSLTSPLVWGMSDVEFVLHIVTDTLLAFPI